MTLQNCISKGYKHRWVHDHLSNCCYCGECGLTHGENPLWTHEVIMKVGLYSNEHNAHNKTCLTGYDLKWKKKDLKCEPKCTEYTKRRIKLPIYEEESK